MKEIKKLVDELEESRDHMVFVVKENEERLVKSKEELERITKQLEILWKILP